MNDFQYKQLKRLYDARNKGTNEREEYLRGLLAHKITEADFLKVIADKIREGLK